MSGIINQVGARSGIVGSDVYPAGHIVQTTTVTKAATRTPIDTSSGYQSTVVTAGITPKYDDSAIIAFMNFNSYWSGESGDFGYAFRTIKAGTGISTTYPLGMYTSYGASGTFHNAHYQSSSGPTEAILMYTLVLQDEDCETTNAITYTLQCAGYNVNTALDIGSNNWAGFQWSMYLQEIKR